MIFEANTLRTAEEKCEKNEWKIKGDLKKKKR